MKNIFITLVLALWAGQFHASFAQNPAPPMRYHVYEYMKVAPGMRDDYLKLEKAWKKIHLAKKQAGQLDDWSFAEQIMPAGASHEYDFVCRNSFVGADQFAKAFSDDYMPSNWQSLLTPDEVKVVERTEQLRTMVKREVWTDVERSMAPDMNKATIFVFNYFKQPAGKTRDDHTKVEKDFWLPMHAARIKDGGMKGWVLLGLDMPFGSSLPYDMATIDVYSDMKQYLTPWFEAYFTKIHPGKDPNEVMRQTFAATDLVKADVRRVVDRLDWK
jgi:hypothetical protein